jgi:hypothetical protein
LFIGYRLLVIRYSVFGRRAIAGFPQLTNNKLMIEAGQGLLYRLGDFLDADLIQAPITPDFERAFAMETRTALDVVPNNAVSIAERTGEGWFSGAEDGDDRDAERGSEMHRAGVVGEQEPAACEFVHQLRNRSLAGEVGGMTVKL